MYCRFPATTVNTATGAYAEVEIYCSLGFPNGERRAVCGTCTADPSPLRSPGANRRLSDGGTDGRPARLLQQTAETPIKQPRRDAQRNRRDVTGPAGRFGQIGRDYVREQQRGYPGSAARRCDLGGQMRSFVRNFRRQNDQASVGAGPIAHLLRFGMTGDNANTGEPHTVDRLDQCAIGCRSANDNNTRARKRHHANRPLLHGELSGITRGPKPHSPLLYSIRYLNRYPIRCCHAAAPLPSS